MNFRSQQQRGFTLIELMVTVGIVAILIGVAAPAFRDFINTQRARGTLSDLRVALMTARSEAVKRNRNVGVVSASGGWKAGWRIPDPNDPVATSLFSHTQSGGDSIAITMADGPVVFRGTGRAKDPATFTVEVGDAPNKKTCTLELSVGGYMEGACP